MNAPVIASKAADVEFRQVSKVYGTSVTAVDSVSLHVAAGELVTLLGPSGCGKTTMLRMIAGLEMVTSGQILIDKRDVSRLSATDRDVSMVFQSYALFPHMTVFDNVAYGLRTAGMKKAEVEQRADAGLDLVGLAGYGNRLPSELSGGQQQRVAVARALVLEPQVLLFDEPLSNLDAKLRRQVREDIRQIQTSLGLTVVYVTHDQEEALAVSDRIIVMKNAVIAQIGTPRELYEAPASEFVADFIGEANMLDVRIAEVHDELASTIIGAEGNALQLQLAARGNRAGPARMAVRPNRIRLLAAGSAATVPGTVLRNTYVGSHRELRVEVFGHSLFVVADAGLTYPEGETIGVGFADTGPVLLPPVTID